MLPVAAFAGALAAFAGAHRLRTSAPRSRHRTVPVGDCSLCEPLSARPTILQDNQCCGASCGCTAQGSEPLTRGASAHPPAHVVSGPSTHERGGVRVVASSPPTLAVGSQGPMPCALFATVLGHGYWQRHFGHINTRGHADGMGACAVVQPEGIPAEGLPTEGLCSEGQAMRPTCTALPCRIARGWDRR